MKDKKIKWIAQDEEGRVDLYFDKPLRTSLDWVCLFGNRAEIDIDCDLDLGDDWRKSRRKVRMIGGKPVLLKEIKAAKAAEAAKELKIAEAVKDLKAMAEQSRITLGREVIGPLVQISRIICDPMPEEPKFKAGEVWYFAGLCGAWFVGCIKRVNADMLMTSRIGGPYDGYGFGETFPLGCNYCENPATHKLINADGTPAGAE